MKHGYGYEPAMKQMLSMGDSVFTSVQEREGRPVKHKEAMLIAFSDM